MEKLLSIYFKGDGHYITLCAKFQAQDGTIHDMCGTTKCCEALKTLPPHKVWKTKEQFEEALSDQYRAGGYHRHSDYSDDLREISAAAVEVLKKFPYTFKEYYNHNTGHSFVKCYTWNAEEEDYTSELWAGSGSCANGLIWIYQNDPDNYIYSVEALREAIEGIYEEPYLSAALRDVDKAEKEVEKIKKSKPSRVDFSSVPVDDCGDIDIIHSDRKCKIPTSGFYGDYYYKEFPEGNHVIFQSGQMKTIDYKDFEPFFRRFYEVTNNKDYIISTLQDALSDFNYGYIKANSVNLCEKREIEYLLLVFNSKNLTPELKTEVQVGITLKNNLTFKYKGEVIESDQVFFKIPVKERKRLWNYLLWFLCNLPPHKGSDWYGQLYPLYQWSMEDKFTSLSKYLNFKVDSYLTIRENSSYDGVWSFYTPSSNIIGKLTFSQQTLNLVKQNTNKIENWSDEDDEINTTNLYKLHEFVLNNGEFYKLIDSLSKFKEIIDEDIFRKLPLIVNNPLNWAVPAGSFKIETEDFKGYLEPITDSKVGYFRYRLRNCDPILGREKVDIKLIIDALPMEELLKAGDFKFDSGWSGTVGEHYWEKINSSEINKWLTPFDVNGKTDSITFFLPDLLIKYRGWQILTKSKYKDEVNTVKLTKEETKGISASNLRKLLNKKAKEIWMSSKISHMFRSIEPEDYQSYFYLKHIDYAVFNNIKQSISKIKSLTKRFNFTKTIQNLMKNVIDGRDLSNETDEVMRNYYQYIGEVDKWWYCKKQPSCDFSKRTIKYKDIVNGEIVEVKKVISISPADRVRDIVDYKVNHYHKNSLESIKREARKFVLNLWHEYKFSWEIKMEFSETVEINGKKISVRKKPVKVSVPRYIEIPKEVVEGDPEVAFASGSLFYIISSLLRLSSYTKTKELKERIVEEVDGFVRFNVDEEWMHRFLINRGAWILHDSNFAVKEKIIHPRSFEVCSMLDKNQGWMDGDKLRFWWRAFSPAYVNKPVTLSFHSREVMRITE